MKFNTKTVRTFVFQFAFASLCLIAIACGRTSTEDIHAHSHELEPLQYTSYSSEFELFAEAMPFVLGESTDILAHFTYLENFAPLREGKVTASVIIGEKGIRQTLDKSLRDGIYRFSLKPVVSGKGKLIFDVITDKGEDRITVNDIQVFADDHAAAQNAVEVHMPSNSIVFTKDQSWKIDFETRLSVKEKLGRVIHTSGLLKASPQNSKILTASSSGLVSLPGNMIKGSSIKKGTLLFNISGSKLLDNNSSVRFLEAKNKLEEARSHLNRVEPLAKEQIVSEQDLLQARLEYQHAEAVFLNLEQNFQPGGELIASPLSGYISEIYVENGSYAESGTPLAKISNTTRMILKADVHPKDAAALQNIASVHLRSNSTPGIFTLEELNGKLLNLGSELNTDNYMLPISFELDNPDAFVSGQPCELWIRTIGKKESITVPQAALIEEQGTYYVMVQVTPELFEKRVVHIGSTDGIKTQVLSGLTEKERYVSKGAIMVKLAQSSGALDPHAGHVH